MGLLFSYKNVAVGDVLSMGEDIAMLFLESTKIYLFYNCTFSHLSSL